MPVVVGDGAKTTLGEKRLQLVFILLGHFAGVFGFIGMSAYADFWRVVFPEGLAVFPRRQVVLLL